MDFLRSLKKNKELIWFLAKDDIKKRYAGSSLGIVWAFAQPLVTITIYWFVFQIGLRSVAPGQYGDMPFLVWIMCGLIPWFFFSDGINSVTSVFLEYSYLVKKVVFDINILPVIKLFQPCLYISSLSFDFHCHGFIWIYAFNLLYSSILLFILYDLFDFSNRIFYIKFIRFFQRFTTTCTSMFISRNVVNTNYVGF